MVKDFITSEIWSDSLQRMVIIKFNLERKYVPNDYTLHIAEHKKIKIQIINFFYQVISIALS